MHRRRWPLAGPRGGRRPPTAAAVMVASALNLHLKRRRLYAGRPSAALAIRKIASALNLHLKGRRLAQVFTSYTRARRRRRCSFLPIRLAALRWSSYGVDADCWPPPRRADGSRRSARSGFRAGTLMALSVGACGALASSAALDFFAYAPSALAACRAKGRSPTAGRSRGAVMVASALNLHLKRRRLYAGRLRPPSRSEKSPVH